MSENSYHAIAFTPGVQGLQEKGGSRTAYARAAARSGGNDVLDMPEQVFIAERDGFFIASVSETGWPYVQFRGGPPGFVRVLDARTIGWADFRGNQQFITTGNVAADSRVSLFFMDYPGRRRLKVFGHLRYLDPVDAPDLAARLTLQGYKARVDRLAVVRIDAWDRNCPQHIPQRYTLAELGLPENYPVPPVPLNSSR